MKPAIPRHIVFFVYPGFVLLDLSGPLEAFAAAASLAPDSYRTSVMSLTGGEIQSSTGLKVMTQLAEVEAIDTFIVVGDFGLAHQVIAPETVNFIRAASANARRTASVCMGAFLLAASGLLEGRRATTHWRFAPKLQAMYPGIQVDGDHIYLGEEGVWTSAGMTAGIDMTLALIEEDCGADISRAVARMMVVYYRRPGGQLQHSSLLEMDPGSDRIRKVLSFARENLSAQLSSSGWRMKPISACASSAGPSWRRPAPRPPRPSSGCGPRSPVRGWKTAASRWKPSRAMSASPIRSACARASPAFSARRPAPFAARPAIWTPRPRPDPGSLRPRLTGGRYRVQDAVLSPARIEF